MKCPGNTSACKVKKIRDGKEKFGSPPAPARTVYQCEFHGYFIKYNDKNALSSFSSEEPEID